jgi:hypothetical protein
MTDLKHRYAETQAQIALIEREIGLAIVDYENQEHRNAMLNVLSTMLVAARLDHELVTRLLVGSEPISDKIN